MRRPSALHYADRHLGLPPILIVDAWEEGFCMPGTLRRDDNGLWFSVDSRCYQILSPVQLNRRSQLVLMLALYNGQGDDCRHQDETNISVAKGRKPFAGGCREFGEEVIPPISCIWILPYNAI